VRHGERGVEADRLPESGLGLRVPFGIAQDRAEVVIREGEGRVQADRLTIGVLGLPEPHGLTQDQTEVVVRLGVGGVEADRLPESASAFRNCPVPDTGFKTRCICAARTSRPAGRIQSGARGSLRYYSMRMTKSWT
jgi:hypothetical protein